MPQNEQEKKHKSNQGIQGSLLVELNQASKEKKSIQFSELQLQNLEDGDLYVVLRFLIGKPQQGYKNITFKDENNETMKNQVVKDQLIEIASNRFEDKKQYKSKLNDLIKNLPNASKAAAAADEPSNPTSNRTFFTSPMTFFNAFKTHIRMPNNTSRTDQANDVKHKTNS